MKQNVPVLRLAVASLIAHHIECRLRQDGLRLKEGADITLLARAVVARWDEAALTTFLHLQAATGFLTKADIAEALGIKSLRRIERSWKTIQKAKVAAYVPGNGEPVTMHLFRREHECAFQTSGVSKTGDVLRGGIRLLLNTERLAFREAIDTHAVNTPAFVAHQANMTNVSQSIEQSSTRERRDYEREVAAVQERGTDPQVAIPLVTGTHAAE